MFSDTDVFWLTLVLVLTERLSLTFVFTLRLSLVETFVFTFVLFDVLVEVLSL